jgi:hypothetical protein
MMSEAVVLAGLTALAGSLGLTTDDDITLTVNGSTDNFKAEIGKNGISTFELSNAKITVLSKDRLYIYLLISFAVGILSIIVFPNLLNAFKKK